MAYSKTGKEEFNINLTLPLRVRVLCGLNINLNFLLPLLLGMSLKLVDRRGVEPLTSTMPLWRSPN